MRLNREGDVVGHDDCPVPFLQSVYFQQCGHCSSRQPLGLVRLQRRKGGLQGAVNENSVPIRLIGTQSYWEEP